MLNWPRATSAVLLLLAGGCSDQPLLHHQRLFVFGTLVDVHVRHDNIDVAHTAIEAVAERLRHIHRQWNPRLDGELRAINRAISSQQTIAVSTESTHLIQQATDLSHRSGELFNPAIGHLIQLWQFDLEQRSELPPPKQQDIDKFLHQHPRMSDLIWRGNLLASKNPAVQLDFGGFAKGVAVDEAIAILRQHGVRHAIVNAGGDLRVMGTAGHRQWHIGIRNPRGGGVIASIDMLDGEVLFTSGDYERSFQFHGRRYHHILDPRSGQPSMGLSSVTVLHDHAAVADAAATALMVSGPGNWRILAEKLYLSRVMVTDEQGRMDMTPKMEARLRFTPLKQ